MSSTRQGKEVSAKSVSAPTERMLTVIEAGEVLNTGPRFPRRLIAERRIRFVRVGRHVRIPESAIAEYVRAQTVEPIRLPGVA